MKLTIISAIALTILALSCSNQQEKPVSKPMEDIIAINIAIIPDSVTTARAIAENTLMRTNHPGGFAFDSTRVPHLTLVQRFVREADLDVVYEALERVVNEADMVSMRLDARAYHYDPRSDGMYGSNGLDVARSDALMRLHVNVIEAVKPYVVTGTDVGAFFSLPGEPGITPTSLNYVNSFVPASSGENYRPHVTVGVAEITFLDSLLAESFTQFSFSPASLAVYQLGDYGTCRWLLKEWPVAE